MTNLPAVQYPYEDLRRIGTFDAKNVTYWLTLQCPNGDELRLKVTHSHGVATKLVKPLEGDISKFQADVEVPIQKAWQDGECICVPVTCSRCGIEFIVRMELSNKIIRGIVLSQFPRERP